ncbi:MAG: cysteine desulfurase [Melioribacteraceae bacterium]|nr:cysteine desulfurase [Melioribacteraceae bacterium]
MEELLRVKKTPNEVIKKRPFNIDLVKKDFPILDIKVNGKPLVYLDNAATTQKPEIVIESIKHYYTHENANVHRGLHFLSEAATSAFENARMKVKEFLNAMSTSEIIFVKGATEAINLIANTMCRAGWIKAGDEIIISHMEHHANIVPWQLMCKRNGAKLRVIPIDDNGELILDDFENMFSEKTKMVSVVHASNSLGTINDVETITNIAHKYDVPVLLDGSQAVAHFPIDVQKLNCDFYVFSGHKIFGPTGIGVLYGRTKYLNELPPYQGGGDMIRKVTFEETTFEDLPNKFEAGTPNIVGGIGLAVALKYLNSFDYKDLLKHEEELLKYATEKLLEVEGLKIIGTAKHKVSVCSFIIDGIHPYDIGTIIDTEGVAIRTGHHCTQPIMQRYNLPATARASFSFYNSKEDVDVLVNALNKVKKLFG